MRKKAITGAGVTAIVLGGGLVLALNGGGSASAERTAAAQAVSSASASASPAATKITRAEAERIAIQAVPGAQVRSAELETEHGATVWSVRVTTNGVTHDLQVDARTGKVVRSGQSAAGQSGAGPAGTGRREPERRDDRAGEAEHRNGGDDGRADDHGRHSGAQSEKNDDHGGDRHGKDDHRG